MQIDLFDIAEFIKINKLQEVSDPVLMVKGSTPSPKGLLSTDIFGVSTAERKRTYAYIDLGAYFLHPFVYKLLKRVDRKFEHIVHSTRKYKIKDGGLVEDEDGETGLAFLYKNWEKIDFKKNDSLIRGERVDLLTTHKKNVLFTKYWLVIPPFYRDVNFQQLQKKKVSHHEINDKYSKILRYTTMIKTSADFDFVMSSTYAKIQDALVDLYDSIKSKVEKKDGMLRKNILGKSVDYGARVVISAPVFDANRYDEMEIDFYHTGVPLAYCCSLFTPFIISWLKNFFRQEFESAGSQLPLLDKDGKVIMVEPDDPVSYFDDELIKKHVNRFIKAPGDRFMPIEIPIKHEKYKTVNMSFTGRYYDKHDPMSTSNIINRPATWCDLLYMAATDVTQDKMIYVTRYPVLDYFGLYPSQVTVLSTKKTMAVVINNKVYKNYPVIDPKLDKDTVSVSFHDTLTMSNLFLKGLGGDYDGDQVSVRAIFTQEANQEARERMLSKSNILGANGQNIRETSNEGIQTLYAMTKF